MVDQAAAASGRFSSPEMPQHSQREGDPAPAAIATAPDDADDDSEWEYELSPTKTETHLITLDLSIPNFIRRRDERVIHHTRGGFRSWMNPIMIGDESPPSRGTARRSRFEPAGEDNGEGEGGERRRINVDDLGNHDMPDEVQEEAHNSGGDEDGALGTPPLRRVVDEGNADKDGGNAPGPVTDDEVLPTEIQILELHSSRPMIAYRGMVFAGSWADTIGTELLFTGKGRGAQQLADGDDGDYGNEIEQSSPVQVMPLKDGVDLIGAASARILCTPIELRPHDDALGFRDEPVLAGPRSAFHSPGTTRTTVGDGTKPPLDFSIPVASNASVQRQKQAAFLERLMAAKHSRGESDAVTVQAVETTQDAVPPGDEEEAQRRARKQAQVARDNRRVLAKREREREQRETRERQLQLQQLHRDAGMDALAASPARRKRSRTNWGGLISGVDTDEDAFMHEAEDADRQ